MAKSTVTYQDSILKANDTMCISMSNRISSLMLIDFCYIRFGDSSGRTNLTRLYNSDFQNQLYNVEPEEDKNLVYQSKGDTIIIRIYYGTRDRKYLIMPDSILFRDGIVYLKEKRSQPSNVSKTYGITLDEVVYRFKKMEGDLPKFRHIWKW